jgi:4-hydroxyphenylpyruvate dioxygenase
MSGIHTYGEVVHLFIERKNYNGAFMPGFKKLESAYNPDPVGLLYVDHCVGNVGWNQMNPWVKFYEEVRGIAPGQSAVFYEGDDVIGGGIIQR